MYRKPRFLELLQEIREQMSRECDYDMDIFAQIVNNPSGKSVRVRTGRRPHKMGNRTLPGKPKAKARRKA